MQKIYAERIEKKDENMFLVKKESVNYSDLKRLNKKLVKKKLRLNMARKMAVLYPGNVGWEREHWHAKAFYDKVGWRKGKFHKTVHFLALTEPSQWGFDLDTFINRHPRLYQYLPCILHVTKLMTSLCLTSFRTTNGYSEIVTVVLHFKIILLRLIYWRKKINVQCQKNNLSLFNCSDRKVWGFEWQQTDVITDSVNGKAITLKHSL